MRKILGITMGDPAGIGAEVTVRALSHARLYEQAVPIVVGDAAVLQDALRVSGLPCALNRIEAVEDAVGKPGVIDVLDLRLIEEWEYGTASAACGEAAFRYIETAIRLAMDGRLSAIVTGPINKEAINMAGHHYAGHTEILGELTGTKKFAMLLSCDKLRVIHVTSHVSMRQACDLLTKERVLDVIRLAQKATRMLGIKRPRIAVAGFNAHSSENGLFGDEEARAIIPAIEAARAEGLDADGPVPPDTVFVKALGGQYDVVVAMYHDQGHIPLKLVGFRMDAKTNTFTSMSGINCTIGLPVIRTSVDHGTAFDRAGQGISNEGSMVEAIEAAILMATNKGAQ